MDIREHWKLPDGGLPGRDRAVADRIRAFVDAALNGGVKVFVTWGLMDKYSWLASEVHVKRQDGLEHRGLPWDDDGHRKLFWLAMAQTLGRA
jgi:endo-1,4-beta-xylanase